MKDISEMPSLYDQVRNQNQVLAPTFTFVPNQIPPVKDMKYDGGKLLANIIFEDFPDALRELVKVATFGAKKYERSSWKSVPNGTQRYGDAKARHFLDAGAGIDNDEESQLDHLAHEAWNCLALLQLKLELKARNAAKQLEAKRNG